MLSKSAYSMEPSTNPKVKSASYQAQVDKFYCVHISACPEMSLILFSARMDELCISQTEDHFLWRLTNAYGNSLKQFYVWKHKDS